MKWLWYRCSVMSMLSVLVVSAAVVFGRMQPLPEQLTALHLGDMCDLPCWIGITPGKTRVGEAQQIIANVYNNGIPLIFEPLNGTATITTESGLILYISLNPSRPSLGPEDSNAIVDRIGLSSVPREIPLGYMVKAIGKPDGVDLGYACCKGIGVTKQWVRIYLPGGSLDEGTPPRYVFAETSVRMILLFTPNDLIHSIPWRGFGTYRLPYELPPVG